MQEEKKEKGWRKPQGGDRPKKPRKAMEVPKQKLPMHKRCVELKKENQEAFLRLYPLKRWNIAATMRELGLERSTFHKWTNDPEFEERVQQAREEHLDWLEDKLHERIEQGSDMLLKFALEKKGKSRGYGAEPASIEANMKRDGMQLLIDFGDDD